MRDLVIVGAGPAGMAAALAAAGAGLTVTVADEQARAGGQIFRRPPAEWGTRHGPYRPYGWARDLIERFEDHPGIQTHFRSTAFGVLRDRDDPDAATLSVAVSTPGGGRQIAARRLLLATGAEIAAIALARDLPGPAEMLRSLPAIPGHVSIFAEAARAMHKILHARVSILRRTVISDVVEGNGGLGIQLAEVDRDWALTGKTHNLSAEVLALGCGFTPSTELARQAGCDLIWNSAGGGWTVEHDDTFRSTAPGIYIAGEPTGVAGAERARAEGHMAGLTIAVSLSGPLETTDLPGARKQLASAERFSGVMQRMFDPRRNALAELSRRNDTVICRCEEITSGQIEKALANNPFMSSASPVKLECRSGTGPRQGRNCEGTIAARIATSRGMPITKCGRFNAHLPVKPIPLEAYRGLDE
ncbi:hypothetical protein KU6B_22080 [Mameliella alba]|uniref:FAD-dependent oxidoreductase n=1 Tax=Mameliella alba TaxID=561184 RepID=UPI0013E478BB|nr:FAD-dependent oxidoreductase [Mameliella alba]BBU55943.1 hypothetical protein KU6B_22080 [Mameliella alba]